MVTNDSNFDFEKYQKAHEGIIFKAGNTVKKVLLKILKFTETAVIVNIISAVFALIQVVQACSSTDPEVIIEKRASELQRNAKETFQLLYSVTLPDSIENQKDIKGIRIFQNKLYSIELQYASLMGMPYINEKDDTTSLTKINLYIKRLQSMGALQTEIDKYVVSVANDESAINPFKMYKLNSIQEKYNGFLYETNSNIDKYIANKDVKGALRLMKKYLTSDVFSEHYKMRHELNLEYLNWTNIELLSKKNKAIESQK